MSNCVKEPIESENVVQRHHMMLVMLYSLYYPMNISFDC